ncbi:MAG: methylated-DNA--[protein]-cysteine S-methyltransferase [Gammaproteobacteria bacterium]|nr:methylated-DNA--[protein]-cysteine S-methyltransferase [Gammaproteobacteria bacterium]
MKTLNEDRYASPLGELVILADDGRLCYLDFADNARRMEKLLTARYRKFETRPGAPMPGLRARLDGYFGGDWSAFDGLDFDTGGSDFQRLVWRGLRAIRPGARDTYRRLASAIGRPRASRAVGAANARNPLSIVIPCHRVTGADGRLRGYAGGVERQAWLLDHERATPGWRIIDARK